MTRKRFIKLLMGHNWDRNSATEVAVGLRGNKTYQRWYEIIIFENDKKHAAALAAICAFSDTLREIQHSPPPDKETALSKIGDASALAIERSLQNYPRHKEDPA